MSRPAIAGSKPRRFFDARDRMWHTQITQGECHVSSETNELIATVLGSCVAACIRDPIAGVGGMNHFLLPEGDPRDEGAARYGAFAMERLVNALLARGALRSRLEGKLFGGANVMASLGGVGWRNAEFAENFLRAEGIAYVGGDLRGTAPRRIQYWPVTGRARQFAIGSDEKILVQDELRAARSSRQAREAQSDVELF